MELVHGKWMFSYCLLGGFLNRWYVLAFANLFKKKKFKAKDPLSVHLLHGPPKKGRCGQTACCPSLSSPVYPGDCTGYNFRKYLHNYFKIVQLLLVRATQSLSYPLWSPTRLSLAVLQVQHLHEATGGNDEAICATFINTWWPSTLHLLFSGPRPSCLFMLPISEGRRALVEVSWLRFVPDKIEVMLIYSGKYFEELTNSIISPSIEDVKIPVFRISVLYQTLICS